MLISIHQFLASDFLRLIMDLGMRTYNRKAREPDRTIAKRVEVCSNFLEIASSS